METNNYNIDAITNEYLNQCVSSFRMDLLHEAFLMSINNKDEHITKHAIDEALFKILRNEVSSYRKADYKNRKIVNYGILIGLLYTLCGCIIFVVQNTTFKPEKDLGQMVMVIGLSLSVIFATWGILIKKAKHLSVYESTIQPHRQYLIIHKWIEIERLLNSFTSIEVNTIQSLLPKLLDLCKGTVSPDEISNVLYLRNKIIHENIKLSDLEINMAIRTENKIIAKLQSKMVEK